MMRTGKSPSIATFRLDSFRPELMDEAVSGGMLDHTQLGKGRFLASLLSADLGESRVDWGRYNLPVFALGEMPRDRVTLGCILRSAESGVLNGIEVRDATPVVLNERAELNYRLSPETQWLAFQTDRDVLESAGVFLPANNEWIPAVGRHAADELQAGLSRALSVLRQIKRHNEDVLNPGALATSLQEGILDLFFKVMASDRPSPAKAAANRGVYRTLVRRASEYMEAHIAEPIRIAALCGATGASWKTLERAFMAAYDVAPKRYLTLRRLTRARRRLLAGSPAEDSVAAIAMDCGCYHAGRFSIAYRELFGESPSATLAGPPLPLHARRSQLGRTSVGS